MLLGTEVDLSLGHIVLDGYPVPSPHERGIAAPLFLAHVYCGQMVAHLSHCGALVIFVKCIFIIFRDVTVSSLWCVVFQCYLKLFF